SRNQSNFLFEILERLDASIPRIHTRTFLHSFDENLKVLCHFCSSLSNFFGAYLDINEEGGLWMFFFHSLHILHF
ncbi:hypothetical protein PMAYCL1PPCAC_19598, partial [Pristionchus mayeri]